MGDEVAGPCLRTFGSSEGGAAEKLSSAPLKGNRAAMGVATGLRPCKLGCSPLDVLDHQDWALDRRGNAPRQPRVSVMVVVRDEDALRETDGILSVQI